MARRAYTLPTFLTDKQGRSLQIIRDEDFTHPARFAELAWPDSPGWNHSRKSGGYGVAKGMGMFVAAGCHLGILERLGLVTVRYIGEATKGHGRKWTLTDDGQRLLDQWELVQRTFAG